jgi:hypothetical protein
MKIKLAIAFLFVAVIAYAQLLPVTTAAVKSYQGKITSAQAQSALTLLMPLMPPGVNATNISVVTIVVNPTGANVYVHLK